jgi:transcriptional regulator with XRE-family HTH domain
MNMRDIYRMQISLGTRLMLLRKESGLRQEDLSELSGVSQAYIAKIERGRVTNVGIEYIEMLAKALDVRVAYLLGLSDVVVEEEEVLELREARPAYEVIDPTMKELLEAIEKMTPGQRQQMLGIARLLLGGPTIIE